MANKLDRLWGKLRRGRAAGRPQLEQGQYRSYLAVHPFDDRFGVETSGLLYDLPSGTANDVHNHGYFAVAPSVFHAVMALLQQQLHLDFAGYTFVDLGSGKGRALLLASAYGFREVVGVELSPALHRAAQSNIAHFAAANPTREPLARSVQQDATHFAWPQAPLLVYMWNAFAWPVLEQVLENLRVSLADQPRDLYLVYMHPELEGMVAGLPWLTALLRQDVAMSDEDYAAWAFPSHAEVCAVYRVVVSGLHTKV